MEDEPLTGSWFNSYAPPPFMVEGETAVPIEARSLELVFEVDVAQRRAVGHAIIVFNVAQAGRPLLDLVARPSRLVLNDEAIPPEQLKLVIPPDENTPLRMLNEQIEAGEHVLKIDYPLRDETVQFADGGARLGLFMTDLDQRGYLERHAPANLEFDQLPLTVELRVSGNTNGHRLFSNGKIATDGGNTWRISFPDYFNCSSCFLHFTNRPVRTAKIYLSALTAKCQSRVTARTSRM